MQQLSWGSYVFQPDTVWFTIRKQPVLGRTNRRNYLHETWVINGRVQGSNSAAVVAQAAALDNAVLNGEGADLVFSLYHSLVSSNTTQGTHVRDFRWLSGYDGVRGSGAELVLRRTFQLIIDGTTVQTEDTDITDWFEEVSGLGTGGPRILPALSMTGYPQAQQPNARTIFTSWQRGRATGLTTTPTASSPIWISTPNVYYFPETLGGGITTPQQWGINQNTQFSINWSYRAWSPTVAMVSNPVPF